MKPGVSHRNTIGTSNASQQLHEPRGLVGAGVSIAPPRCAGLLATMPTDRPSIRVSAVIMPSPNPCRSSSTEPVSHNASMTVRTSYARTRFSGTRWRSVRWSTHSHSRDVTAEVREVLLRDADGLGLVAHEHVDHAVRARWTSAGPIAVGS